VLVVPIVYTIAHAIVAESDMAAGAFVVCVCRYDCSIYGCVFVLWLSDVLCGLCVVMFAVVAEVFVCLFVL